MKALLAVGQVIQVPILGRAGKVGEPTVCTSFFQKKKNAVILKWARERAEEVPQASWSPGRTSFSP